MIPPGVGHIASLFRSRDSIRCTDKSQKLTDMKDMHEYTI